MSIRIPQVIISLVYTVVLWGVTVAGQVSALSLLVYGTFMGDGNMVKGGFLIGILAAAMTFPLGGLNAIPALFWRFRKNIETRVVQVEDKYALQMRLFGRWFWVDVNYVDWIHVVWTPDLSVGDFYVGKKTIQRYEEHLGIYLQSGFADHDSVESIRRGTYVRGEKQ